MTQARILVRIIWCVMLAAVVPAALAVDLTPEQLQLINQLSPEQRAAALKAVDSQGGKINQPAPESPPVMMPPKERGPSALEAAVRNGSPRDAASAQKDEGVPAKSKSKTKTDFTSEGKAEGEVKKVEGEVKKIGETAKKQPPPLRQFGYDLFSGTPTTFAPATDIPVPSDYVIGPGDTVEVQLFGQQNAQYNLAVTRDGTLQFPGIGAITVAGLSFDELKSSLNKRVAHQFIGVTANITMGPLRSIRVFVLGDVEQPGSYTVSSLSTMTNALLVSGGVKPIGSLRNIELKRKGQVITRMDLYDLLLRGDTRADARLLPGDVIFVPPIGPTVGVAGEVKRPAIYEIKNERTLKDALTLAGGLLPTAYPEGAQLERINERRARTLVDVDLNKSTALTQAVREGDVLWVYSVLDRMDEIVLVSGNVQRPGGYQWRPGMRITDLIPTVDAVLPKSDLNYALIRRELPPDRRIQALSVNLGAAIASPKGPADIELKPRDRVTVFNVTEPRGEVIDTLLDELTNQATKVSPAPIVSVGGRVRTPGNYPLESGMRVSDLVRAGGDLAEEAYGLQAEITRYEVMNGEHRATQNIVVDLAKALAGDAAQNIELKPHDQLIIKELPQWAEQQYVEVRGEVRFPGKYPVTRGETLKHVLQRAGGLTTYAYAPGAVFMREELRRKEQEHFDQMAARLRGEIAAKATQVAQTTQGAASNQQSVQIMQQLVTQLETTKAAGRLVIDLPALIAEGSEDRDVVLKDGDTLFVPATTQEVTVIGEVFYQTSHLYEPNHVVDDYVNRSGGTTRNADESHTYVIRANGSVIPTGRTSWFKKTSAGDVQPGDTIVVPLDIERVQPLTIWTNVSQIFYQLGVAVAAWHTVGVF